MNYNKKESMSKLFKTTHFLKNNINKGSQIAITKTK